MEHRGYGWDKLTEEDVRAIEYEAGRLDDMDFRLGQYERDFAIEGVLMRNTYEIGDHHMEVRDAVWGNEYIGDQPYD